MSYTRSMRAVIATLLLSIACGSNAPATEAPGPEPAFPAEPAAAEPAAEGVPAAAESAPVEEVARRLYTAIYAVDGDTVRELALTYEELRSLTRKDVTREEHEAAVSEFIKPPDGPIPVTEVIGVEIIEAGWLRPEENEKVKREIEYAVVRATIRREGQQREAMPLLFFKLESGWKFSPRA